ncbi:Uncharacterised protein [Mycobacteroides abscessus]|nr:Uncharacterised protein [Mycobacteroides abscessus]
MLLITGQTVGCGGGGDQGVDLAAQADAEGSVQEGRAECEGGGDHTEQCDARGKPDSADGGEGEAQQLRELQRGDRLTFGHRAQPRLDQCPEDRSVRGAMRA